MEPPAKRSRTMSSTNGAQPIEARALTSGALRQPVRVPAAGTEIRPPASRHRAHHPIDSDTNSIVTTSEADDEEAASLRRRRLRDFCYDSGVGQLSARAKALREERLKERRECRKQARQPTASSNSGAPAAKPKRQAAPRGPLLQVVAGRIQVQRDSLVVRPDNEGLELDGNVEEVEESDRYVTSASFSRRSKTDRWSIAATEGFYRVREVVATS